MRYYDSFPDSIVHVGATVETAGDVQAAAAIAGDPQMSQSEDFTHMMGIRPPPIASDAMLINSLNAGQQVRYAFNILNIYACCLWYVSRVAIINSFNPGRVICKCTTSISWCRTLFHWDDASTYLRRRCSSTSTVACSAIPSFRKCQKIFKYPGTVFSGNTCSGVIIATQLAVRRVLAPY